MTKHKPSYPGLTDTQEPTNGHLWQAMLELAEGRRLEYRQGDRIVHSPNGARGYRNMPNNPYGIAWAIKQYKGFGGAFIDRKKEAMAPHIKYELGSKVKRLEDLAERYKSDDDVLSESDFEVLCAARDWLHNHFEVKDVEGESFLVEEGKAFLSWIDRLCEVGQVKVRSIDFSNFRPWMSIKDNLDKFVGLFGLDRWSFENETALECFAEAESRLDALFENVAKGWRAKTFIRPLKVVWVTGTVPAFQYVDQKNELRVKLTPKIAEPTTGMYGSFDYMILRELGKVYAEHNPLPADFDTSEWRTTRYSYRSGEGFPELFALSFFGVKGPWEASKLSDFENLMSQGSRVASSPRDNWTDRLRRMAAGGIEVFLAGHDARAKLLEERSLLANVRSAHGQTYWQATQKGKQAIVAAMLNELRLHCSSDDTFRHHSYSDRVASWAEETFLPNTNRLVTGRQKTAISHLVDGLVTRDEVKSRLALAQLFLVPKKSKKTGWIEDD